MSSSTSETRSRRITNVGASRLGVFLIGRVISPLERHVYRLTGGRISLTRRSPVLLLTTTGRKSGRPRTVPVFFLRDGTNVIVCNVTPPGERTNPWTLNLRADARAHVQIGDTTIDCIGREATSDEVARYWPQLVEIWPAYARFADAGGRRSVFVLAPI